MRIGIFGGTFDPPHVGHLLAAGDAADALALDRIVLVPAAEQPLKRGTIEASPEARLEMVRRLAGNDPRFEVDPIEIERGGLSFMVDTLREFRERWREDRELALFLLLGADAAASLPKWREPAAVTALADVVVLVRADGDQPSLAGARRVSTRRVDVSSTEIRARVRAGKSIHGFVPDAVAEYIAGHRLYR
jgi:nicotinate-nucleotide adenylyltransferase